MKLTVDRRIALRRVLLIATVGLTTPASPRLALEAADSSREDEAAKRTRYVEDLNAFFEEMDKTYPFFDLKGIRKEWATTKLQLARKVRACRSDSEFLGLVVEAIRCLRDAHIGIVKAAAEAPASEPEYYPGVSFLPATGNRVVVMSTLEGLPEELAPGTVVTHIDRKPARRYLDALAKIAWSRGGHFSSPQRARLFEYRIPLRGKKDDKHRLTILVGRRRKHVELESQHEARGWPHTYNLPDDLEGHGGSLWYSKLASGVGYLYLRRIGGATESGIAAALSAHPDASGWIVDLRGNGGGGYSGGLIGKLSEIPGPVAALIDAGCISAGETLARDLVHYAKARLFGSPSAGASSAKRTWDFPSGAATLVIPTRSRFGINRKPIEYLGIRPDEIVEATPEEVASGKNSGILRAEEYILKERRR